MDTMDVFLNPFKNTLFQAKSSLIKICLYLHPYERLTPYTQNCNYILLVEIDGAAVKSVGSFPTPLNQNQAPFF